ncbi:MAG: hypothetical protein KBG15_15940 [Kofleriaceae bacterium]|nr:hypothetical protein [Kofleriaceae bacterium]
MTPHTLIIIDVASTARGDQAWRAALGATLTGGAVHVVVTPPALQFCHSALAQRARHTLEAFGHHCEAAPLDEALRRLRQHVEVWR